MSAAKATTMVDELVAAAGGDPLAAALDIAEQRLAANPNDEGARALLADSILPALEERVRARREAGR